MDGTLLDSESDLSWLGRAADATLRELDLPRTDHYRGILYAARDPAFRQLATDVGMSVRELWELRDSNYYREKHAAIEARDLRPFPDVDALYRLPETTSLHVISNSPQETVDQFIDQYELTELFSVRIGRSCTYDALQSIKPHAYFFEKLLAQTQDSDAPYVYVGNTDSDAAFARNAGIEYRHVDRQTGDDLPTVLADIIPPPAEHHDD